MMRLLMYSFSILITLTVVLITCKRNDDVPIICNIDFSPSYDTSWVKIRDEYGNFTKDTFFDIIDKHLMVFKPCKTHKYSTTLIATGGDTIIKSSVYIVALGKKWIMDRNQDAVIYVYMNYLDDKKKYKYYNINPEAETWTRSEESGIIENKEKLWMHPFRVNQYELTQVCPFPQVLFPLFEGKTYSSNITIIDYGIWSNTNINSNYLIVGKQDFRMKNGKNVEVWKVESKALSSFGESTLDFYYSEELGFVKFCFNAYNGLKLFADLEML